MHHVYGGIIGGADSCRSQLSSSTCGNARNAKMGNSNIRLLFVYMFLVFKKKIITVVEYDLGSKNIIFVNKNKM